MNMKKQLYGVLMLFLCVFGFISCGKKEVEFRVASYNIRYAAPADENSGNGWDVRKAALAEVITRYDFDVVGTQEGNDKQLADLQQLLPGYAYLGHSYGGRDGKLHNCATYYKTDLFEAQDSGTFWFSETPDVYSLGWDADDPRICHWVKLREKKSGAEFFLFNSHFYWRYKTAKANSGAVLVQKVKEIAGDAPVICVGDFNSDLSTPQLQEVLTVLKDARSISETPAVGPLNTAFPGGVFEGEAGTRLDYIFLSPQFHALNYTSINDTYKENRYPSDHFPVTSKVVLSW